MASQNVVQTLAQIYVLVGMIYAKADRSVKSSIIDIDGYQAYAEVLVEGLAKSLRVYVRDGSRRKFDQVISVGVLDNWATSEIFIPNTWVANVVLKALQDLAKKLGITI